MTELTLLYILIAITAVLLIGLIMVIMINRGLNREVNTMVSAYQNLTRQVEDIRSENQNTVQTLQSTFKVFGDMISQNQRDSAENLDKRLADLNTRFSHMAVENEQKLENIRTSMEKKIGDLTEDNNKQLEKMRETVDEKLQKTLEDRISQSFKLVSERLEQVYKGLGEMDEDQLWETTLDPARRKLKRVEIEDARMASDVTELLMGNDVPPRKAFIYRHAKDALLDV